MKIKTKLAEALMENLKQGDRVVTSTGKHGTVAYVRMGPPDYHTVTAISVVLDDQKFRPGYSGTMFSAADVKKAG